MLRTLITTADGSHSLYVKDLDEHYHSIHGAIQESKHVFIDTGLKHMASKGIQEINILEIGFGTGLNTILTLLETEKLNVKTNYTSLEAYPLGAEITSQLNYSKLITSTDREIQPFDSAQNDNNELINTFNNIHTCDWEKEIEFSKHFTLHKIKNTLQEVSFKNSFDLIYFDAFGPRVQPEMWTEELLRKIFDATKPGGCIVTYCAKGEVKRTLKKVGYIVETLPGPPRKREMVRGTKN
ncbi:MAG: tRNA (5-methylaminomethyl-2-thiouridine)(34)-methyltransferase MnmD [Bacteroidetes bacterium]|nr:tRNA (5-methylaminomethyl-2-thiouridine)(34)-methyltransferase MnmD [Bacteroidota bacterium]